MSRTVISRHRTIQAVAKAAVRFGNRVEKSNGKGCFIPSAIRILNRAGHPELTSDAIEEAYLDAVAYLHGF